MAGVSDGTAETVYAGDRTAFAGGDPPYPGVWRGYYATGILMLAYTLSFVDRQLLNLVVDPVKRDLGLSDTQISLLQGFAFAIFYTAFGLILGRLADHWNRRKLITRCMTLWCLATACCGLAGSALGLFAARIFVGVGEAGLSPSAYSMLSDYFDRSRRGRAMGIYSLGVYLGSGLAFIFGGLIIAATSHAGLVTLPLVGLTLRPWQFAFFLVATPGIFIIPLMLTVREPFRRERQQSGPAGGMANSIGYLLARRSFFAPALFGYAVLAIVTFAYTGWIPTAFIREFGWSARDIGLIYGAIMVVFGSAGMLFAGFFADRLVARGRHDAHMLLSVLGTAASVPMALLMGAMPGPMTALIFVAATSFLISMSIALAPAVLQNTTPNRLRGQTIAIYFLLISFIGQGGGPLLVALGTDRIFGDPVAVRSSITLVTTAATALSVFLLWRALEPYRAALAEIDS